MERCTYDPGAWNLVIVARDGMTGTVHRRLATVARARSTPYRGVLIGQVGADPLSWLSETWKAEAELFRDVVRITPVQGRFRFERDDVTEILCEALALRAEAPLGNTFYVRARLRGLDGRLEARAVERAVGAFLQEQASTAGRPAAVRFDDPDTVVAIEVVGRQVGYGLLDRHTRLLPMVRPR